ITTEAATRLAVEALYDAADDDTATGGPDLSRKIFPVVMTATAQGTHRLPDTETAALAEAIVEARTANPTPYHHRAHHPDRTRSGHRRPTEETRTPWPCSSMRHPSRSCATARSSPARTLRAVATSW